MKFDRVSHLNWHNKQPPAQLLGFCRFSANLDAEVKNISGDKTDDAEGKDKDANDNGKGKRRLIRDDERPGTVR